MLFKNLSQFLGSLTLITLFTACGDTTEIITPTVVTEQAKIMFYNGGSAGSFYALNDKKVTDSLEATAATAYLTLDYTPSLTNIFKLKSSTGADMTNQTVTLKKDLSFSFFTWKTPLSLGTPQGYGSILVEDNLTAPTTGKAKLRGAIMNRDGGAAYDVVMTNATQGQKIIFTNVSLGKVTDFTEIEPGTYNFTFYNTGGAQNFGGAQNIKIEADKIYTLATSNNKIASSEVTASLIVNK
jgi:hypothetical protein